MNPNAVIRMCAWHEAGQVVLFGFMATHGICPICFDALMKHKSVQYVQLMADGGWEKRPSGGFWPIITRTINGYEQACIRPPNVVGWQLWEDGQMIFEGTLDECLIKAEG